MSRTYELICLDCKKRLWVGQGDSKRKYLYTTEKHLENLNNFLFSHERHKIKFGDDEFLDTFDYEEVGDIEDA